MKKKVLIIDDEKDFCYFLKKNLELSGDFSVFTLSGSKWALFAAAVFKPAVIILDVMMPGTDGYAVLEKLKKNPLTMTIPVVMLSALHASEDKLKAAHLYSEEYVVKPVEISFLRGKIESCLNRLN